MHVNKIPNTIHLVCQNTSKMTIFDKRFRILKDLRCDNGNGNDNNAVNNETYFQIFITFTKAHFEFTRI